MTKSAVRQQYYYKSGSITEHTISINLAVVIFNVQRLKVDSGSCGESKFQEHFSACFFYVILIFLWLLFELFF